MKALPTPVVGLMVDADPNLLVGLLAAWKAGCAFVPLDPREPVERCRRIAEDCGLRLLLTETAHLERAREVAAAVPGIAEVVCLDAEPALEAGGGEPAAGPERGPGAEPADPAYVLYTSGSTGEPKGVVVTHANLAPLLAWSGGALGLRPGVRVLQTLSHTFDFGLFEVLTTLLAGGTLYQPEREERLDPALFARALHACRAELLHVTPSVLREVAPAAGRVASLATVHLGGEALTPAVVESAAAVAGASARVLNGYGPTEATVNATLEELRAGAPVPVGSGGSVPIGRPSAANRAYVLDARLRPVPPGMPGELCIGGPGVALGYLGRPRQTAERFLPDPWAGLPGARLYRSGDLVRWRPRGSLDFLGRVDRQVKLRGFRIEPGEVERVLCLHPGVEAAAVGVRSGTLVAWVVGAGGEDAPDGEELRGYLRERLPAPMVPAALVAVPSLPRTAHGKLDESRLPDPLAGRAGTGGPGPRTPTEEVVAAVCGDELAVGTLGVHDDLFEAGCHSLLAMRIVTRLREAFRAELPLVTLFEHPTIAGLARAIEQAAHGTALPPLTLRPRDGADLPLSYSQEQIWLMHRMDPASVAYHVPRALRMRGPVVPALLRRAFTAIVERHEILRTTFHDVAGVERMAGGTAVQRVHPPYPVDIPVIDLSALAAEERLARVRQITVEEGQRPFDLGRGPMLRLRLLRLAADDHVLVVCEHHLVHDGWTQGVLVRDFLAYYSAFAEDREADLPVLEVQYGDYALWQRRHLGREVLQPQLDWWRERLTGAPELLELPTDFPRPAVQTTRGDEVELEVDGDLADALRAVAQDAGSTLFMVLLAAFKALLRRYGAQEDLVLGTAAANRRLRHLEGMLGMVINTLVLRTDLSGDPPFREALERTRRTCLDAYGRQDLPFEWLVEAVQPTRVLSHQPLFQVMFSMLDTPMPPLVLPGLELELLPSHNLSSKWDFDLMVIPHREQRFASIGGAPAGAESGLTLIIEFSTDLYEKATMERLARHYRELLAGIVADPRAALSALPLLDAAERRQVLAAAAGDGLKAAVAAVPEAADPGSPVSGSSVPGATVVERLAAHAVRAPGDAALVCGERTLGYGELMAAVDATARRLRRRGFGPETVVVLRGARSPELVIGLLAILRAGGAYLPLDPALPAVRAARMVADAGARWLVGGPDEAGGDDLGLERIVPRVEAPGEADAAGELPPPDPRQLAYLMYTSGSTGEPKGVGVSHGSLAWYAEAARRIYGVAAGERVLQFSSLSFDISVEEIFVTLAAGGTLVVHPQPSTLSVAELLALCAEQRVSLLSLPTAWWHHLAAEVAAGHAELPACLERVVLGGERALAERMEGWRRAVGERVATFNSYGPTEATVVATCHRLEPRRPPGRRSEIPIGRPIPGARAWVLDDRLRLAPYGLPGELVLGGPGVARGYHGRPAATAAAFVPDPYSGAAGARMYRTGDRARLRPDGQLEFLARQDAQVKIRGFRVEPAEVEAALASHPAVRQAVVEPRTAASGERRLVAWLAADPAAFGGAGAVERAMRRYLLDRLPDYMVPADYLCLDELPLTPQGKVDRRALPAPEERAPAVLGRRAPRTPLEETVAALWAESLGRPRVGLGDDFFALGGHSLSGTRLVARVRTVFGVELPLRDLFQRPTVEGMAEAIAERLAAGAADAPGSAAAPGGPGPLVPVPRDGELPLSFAQQRLWFLDQLEPGSAAYNLAGAYRLRGALSLAALAAAFRAVADRHEVLRTTFPVEAGRPRQRIAGAPAVRPAVVDLSALADPAAAATRLARREAATPFDLAAGPLLRVRVLRLAADDHLLVVNLHHIAGDGWSIALLAEEVRRLYAAARAGEPARLAPLPVQYADYAVWQRRWLAGERLAAEVEWWRERLAGAGEVLELPADRSRPATQRHRGANLSFRLPPALAQRLREVARQHSGTTFMVLLAAFETLLHRYTGHTELSVGTPVAGRRFAELEGLIGFFVNTLVLRSSLAGDPSFGELVDRVRHTVLEADAHQDVPFERLVEELAPERNLSHAPLFQVMFAFLDLPEHLELPGLAVEEWPLDTGTSKFDWTVLLTRGDDGSVGATLNYDTDLFDAATMERVARHFRALLAAAAQRPWLPLSRLPLLAAAERQQLLAEWNDTAAASSGSRDRGSQGRCAAAASSARKCRATRSMVA
ncbi:MAG TPA: amino acid adenylation domain-containing protein, partial [Thermoanaerobaculia bacterium]|nr:amino acid adenylation domain-containing protein [Thermoanaerobaculia bacterium]